MKKFVAKVEIYLDDDPHVIEAHGFVNTFYRPPDRDDGPEMFFQVNLPPSEEGNNASTLAHELGHVVAHIYKTNASQADDIAQKVGGLLSMVAPLNVGDFKDAMFIKLEAEKEAWEIARKIYPDLNPADEKEALGSYEKGLKDAKF